MYYVMHNEKFVRLSDRRNRCHTFLVFV